MFSRAGGRGCRSPPPAQYWLVLDSWERSYSLASDLAFEYGSDAGRFVITCFLIRLPDRIGNVEVFFFACFHRVQQLFCCLCRIGCLDPVFSVDGVDRHMLTPFLKSRLICSAETAPTPLDRGTAPGLS